MQSEQTTHNPAQTSPMPEITVNLTVAAPNSPPEKVELRFLEGKNRLRVGRDGQNECRLQHASVSKFHASLLMKPDGTLFVADLDSSNGTSLNGKRLKSGAAYEIEENDALQFGEVKTRFNWTVAVAPKLTLSEETALTAIHETNEADAMPTIGRKRTTQPLPASEKASERISVESPEKAAEPEIEKAKSPTQSVAKSAGIVSIAVMGSRVIGLVREQVFAAILGASALYDAYLVAFRIPNLLRDLFAEGALSTAFVKTFTDYQVNRSEAEAWRLASLIFNALVVILSVISIGGILLAPYIIQFIAPGFAATPGKSELTATMTQIMFPFLLLVAMAAVAMGVLNTKGIFGIPASASTVFNVVSIITGLGLAYILSGGKFMDLNDPAAGQWSVIGLSIGTMLGGAAQFLMQVPSLIKVGFRFSPILSFADEGVRKVFWLMTPAILGTSAVQINVMVNTSLVSDINSAQSWLNCAFRLMQLPIGIFGVAIATAAIPAISKFAAQKDETKFRETIGSSIRLVFLLTVPSACGLFVLGEPIIRLLYERGNFNSEATAMTAWALSAYAVGLTGYAAIKIISPAFYALDDTRTPMIVSLASIVVNVGVGYGFLKLLSNVVVTTTNPVTGQVFEHNLAHMGVALATSCIALVNFFALVFLLRRKIKRIEGRKILFAFIKVAIASSLLSVVSYFSYFFLHRFLGGGDLLFRLIEVFVPIALGGGVFLVTAFVLRVAELKMAIDTFARKFRLKKS